MIGYATDPERALRRPRTSGGSQIGDIDALVHWHRGADGGTELRHVRWRGNGIAGDERRSGRSGSTGRHAGDLRVTLSAAQPFSVQSAVEQRRAWHSAERGIRQLRVVANGVHFLDAAGSGVSDGSQVRACCAATRRDRDCGRCICRDAIDGAVNDRDGLTMSARAADHTGWRHRQPNAIRSPTGGAGHHSRAASVYKYDLRMAFAHDYATGMRSAG